MILLFAVSDLVYWCFLFFFNDTATPEIYTLSYTTLFRSLVDVEPEGPSGRRDADGAGERLGRHDHPHRPHQDRKSTRLNSSHSQISYAVFCLKKKKRTAYTPVRI